MATTKALELSQLAKGITVDASGNITAIAATTDVISEGSSNLYYTTTRANTDIDARVDKTFVDNLGVDYTSLSNLPTIPSLTGYATETYVDTAVSNLVDSAPGTLDTLNELAAALGDDPNFATTVTNSIATKWTQDNTKISNWDTAYSWGDHGTAGYLTSFTETDPIFSASPSASIVNQDISNWNAAFAWGDHNAAGYLTSFTETDPVFLASAAANVTTTKINNWDTAYSWGDHAAAGYGTVDDATALAIALG